MADVGDAADPEKIELKRERKLTEKALEARLNHYINSRRVRLRQLTRKTHDLQELLGNNPTFDEVNEKYKDFNANVEVFQQFNQQVLKCLNESEHSVDQQFWYQPKLERCLKFSKQVHAWLVEKQNELVNESNIIMDNNGITDKTCELVDTRSEHKEEYNGDVSPVEKDVTSTVIKAAGAHGARSSKGTKSGHSLSSGSFKGGHSAHSSSFSGRLKEEAKRAALAAQAAALEHKKAIALKEAELAIEKEQFQIETKLAMSDAKLRVFHNYSCADSYDEYQEDELDPPTSVAEIKREADNTAIVDPPPETEYTFRSTHQAAGARVKTLKPTQTPSSVNMESDYRLKLMDIMKEQMGITKMLTNQQQMTQLPKREISVFTGDPLSFRSFQKAFHLVVDSKTDSNADKLYFLEQYTRGEAQNLVRSCQHMPAHSGYNHAMSLLEDHYGHPLKIAAGLTERLFNWPLIKSEDAKALNSFSLFLVSCQNAMQDVEYMDELDSATSLRAIISKLPYKIRDKWRTHAHEITDDHKSRVKFVDLVSFITREARIMNNPLFGHLQITPAVNKDKRSVIPENPPKGDKAKESTFATTLSTQQNRKPNSVKSEPQSETIALHKPCLFCKKSHALIDCYRFAGETHQLKLDFLRRIGLCFSCLIQGHMAKDCKRKLKCTVCPLEHPKLLHIYKNGKLVNAACQTENSSTEKTASRTLIKTNQINSNGAGDNCILSILPVYVKSMKGNKMVQTYAFLDPGSSASFCTEALVEQLNLSGQKTKGTLVLKTMNATSQTKGIVIKNLEISGINEHKYITIPKLYLRKRMPVESENIPCKKDIEKWQYLKDVTLPQIDAEVGLLIGNDIYEAFEPWEVINSKNDGPYAVKTVLGWIVNGPIREQNEKRLVTTNRISVSTVESLLMQQYEADFPEHHHNEKMEMSTEDKAFLHSVSRSIQYKDGHYYIKLPTKVENMTMPNNKEMALQRALTLKKRLSKNTNFNQEYSACIKDMLKKGYAVKIQEAQLQRNDGKLWYIPHHGVYHPQKKKLRVVFDCGASFQGVSLNKMLLQGPDLTNSVIGVLTRFRQEPVALMADIEAMYHQVRVPEEDTDLLRFLWWPEGDLTQPLAEYKMVVHLFGATSSASCANYALRKTAEDNRTNSAFEVVDTVMKNFYVDDCLKSVASEKAAISLREGLTNLCASGGFHLTTWTSNSRVLLKSIPELEKAKEVRNLDLIKDTLPVERALGVLWCKNTDMFKFSVCIKQKPATRRGVLSVVSSIYDPLGFLSPIVLPAKGILQRLSKDKLSWDEEIPPHLTGVWSAWVSQLPPLCNFKIPRCIKPVGFGHIASAQLNHFSDASESGYGSVSYLKLTNENGAIHCAFMMGKARVAPLKLTTIPRMELTAAVLAVNMDKILRKELTISLLTSVFWTDSTAVLKYIANNALRLKTFVANRIAIIKEATDVNQWHHVDTKENPADFASRGLTVKQFLANQSWLNGPPFLKHTHQKPNICNFRLSEEDVEVRKVTVNVISTSLQTSPLEKLCLHYSSWRRLKRAVAWILRVKDLLLDKKIKGTAASRKTRITAQKKHSKKLAVTLTVDELKRAEKEIIRYCQSSSFRNEMNTLQSGNSEVSRKSNIYKLNPVLQNGVLRVGGRLSRSAMPEDAKHPAIMPKEHHVTSLLLQDIHEKTGHSGRNFMLSRLRQRFWVPAANSAVRKIVSQCVICKKRNAKAQEQKMADLPIERLLPDKPPFTSVGMDYFGPFEVKRGRSLVKRYGILFTCLTTRALHIEVAHSLDTDSCINGIRRFMCRRGQVSLIRSDNGTNMVGAERELREAIRELDKTKIQNTLSDRGIQWIFNPPAGAHFGGVWESQVKLIKKILKSVLNQQTMDDECLQTLFCEVESIINDRPITTPSDDPNDLEPLTPNHLLLLKKQPLMPPCLFNSKDCYSRRRWKQTQYMADLFWKRWVKEYLPNLQQRQKWVKERQNLGAGDVVMILDDSAPRNTWLLGRVLQAIADDKGLVRRVLVKTKSSTLERPVDKLCLLYKTQL